MVALRQNGDSFLPTYAANRVERKIFDGKRRWKRSQKLLSISFAALFLFWLSWLV